MLPKEEQKKYTYSDYLKLPEDRRVELIYGDFWDMSPAPSPDHQFISAKLSRRLGNFLEGKPCQVAYAPFDVILTDNLDLSDDDIDTVVQPDLFVTCDSSRITKRGHMGAPDLVVEIWSPSTGYNDATIKMELYERFGVKEYWMVHPVRKTVHIYLLGDNGYEDVNYFHADQKAKSVVLKGFSIPLTDLFS